MSIGFVFVGVRRPNKRTRVNDVQVRGQASTTKEGGTEVTSVYAAVM